MMAARCGLGLASCGPGWGMDNQATHTTQSASPIPTHRLDGLDNLVENGGVHVRGLHERDGDAEALQLAAEASRDGLQGCHGFTRRMRIVELVDEPDRCGLCFWVDLGFITQIARAHRACCSRRPSRWG